MIVATSVELKSLFGGSLDGSGSAAGAPGEPSGTWIVEPSTWIRPTARVGRGLPFQERRAGRPSPAAGVQPPLAPGDRLGGYRLMERLGRGGQGDVWKALRRD